jgi:hypothetical protein
MSQPFWLALLRDVYGVEYPEQFITFEEQVHLDHTSFIDGFIPTTKVLEYLVARKSKNWKFNIVVDSNSIER